MVLFEDVGLDTPIWIKYKFAEYVFRAITKSRMGSINYIFWPESI